MVSSNLIHILGSRENVANTVEMVSCNLNLVDG